MGDAVAELLPFLPAAPALVGLLLISARLFYLWNRAIGQLEREQERHSQTQQRLDEERERRRAAEDDRIRQPPGLKIARKTQRDEAT